MSHVAKSRILEDIIIEIRKTGRDIPLNVLNDLKSARTLIKIQGTDSKGAGETEPRIDQYLSKAEAYLITEAEKSVAPEKVQKWLTALDLASCDTCVKVIETKEEMRFIPGVPRDQKWIRVEPVGNLPLEKLEQFASEAKLGSRRDSDGHLIVFGSGEAVKGFIKTISRPTWNSRNDQTK
jgi:hypothetical protein